MMKNIEWIPVKTKNRYDRGKSEIGRYSILTKISKQKGYVLINQLLEKFTFNFVIENESYHYWTSGDWAFNYKEKQLHSIIFPAFNKSVSACLLELPFNRTTFNNSKTNGYIDYLLVQWTRNKNYILTEVKHSKIYPKKNYLSKLKKKWRELLLQLDTLKGDELIKYKRAGKVFKLGLLVAPIILNYSQTFEFDDKELKKIINNINNVLDLKPNWISLASSNNGGRMYYQKKSEETSCPAIIIMAYVNIEELS